MTLTLYLNIIKKQIKILKVIINRPKAAMTTKSKNS